MTPELTFLALTAALAATLWVPVVIGVASDPQTDVRTITERPPDLYKYPAWVQRAFRAHMNLLEQFLPFAVLVVIAHMMGVSTPVTVWACGIFFVARLVHAAGMIPDVLKMPWRPLVFSVGYICVLALLVEILRA